MLVCVCVFLLAGQRSQTTCARRIRRLPRCRGRDALSIRQQASQGTARRARHLKSPLHNPTQQPTMTRIQCGVDNKCSSTAKSKSSFLWKKNKSSSRDLRQLPWWVAHKKGVALPVPQSLTQGDSQRRLLDLCVARNTLVHSVPDMTIPGVSLVRTFSNA